MAACSKCGEKHQRVGQRYCRACQTAYNRTWRKTHPLSDEARKRDTARSHASVGKKRGQLVPLPCLKCGEPQSEMHHPDHELPRMVVWLCRPCHLAWHAHWRAEVQRVWDAWTGKPKRSEAA